MSEQPLLQASGIRFSYQGQTPALDGLNFSARHGEFVGVIGANGSGKTTLFKMLLRLLTPAEGTVELEGKDIRQLAAAALYQQVGMVFQNPNDQLFASTVEEDVAFGPRNLGLPESEVEARIAESLEATGTGYLRSRPIHHLSFGEQKRVCLAGVLAMRPSILLLDEPTSGLDPNCERLMVELLTRLNREQGITVIMATHAVDLLGLLATRLVVLCRGTVLRTGSPREIFGDPELIARAGLRLPFVSQLFHDLAGNGDPLPLTVDEARQRLAALLGPLALSRESAP